MDQNHTLTAPAPSEEAPAFSAAEVPGAEDTTATAPAEGSDAAASLEFGRNLARLRESRGLSHNKLAALADIAADSIREYEQGKYRPKQPKLWGLAKALDVMPIALGPGSTRGGEAPVPVELLLRKKGGRALRLQRLVELLSEDGRVSDFARQAGLKPEEVYATTSSEVQLTEEQLEAVLRALPRVRRSWLMSGEGAPLQRVEASAPVTEPRKENQSTQDLQEAVPSAPEQQPAFRNEPLRLPPAPSALTRPLAVASVAGAPMYVQLGTGLVAEVDAALLDGAGAVTGFRLLAGAGGLPVLTTADQLERLFHALRGVLDQRGGE
ncbi:helix-turn-helix transcriptional regulator [Hymenobacter sp. YC55]|uniref:helix-turn-helix domain-containing protein n=1 Tax=Hymenobacter sp. YC55 TaxID=3034019 RepID=UPI0023FA35C3|nr:helix-turn-helix transcriptional regulator [Hymenobacter sp. YC55]MDF7815326.1 helix-turn-helix transcriptional regulator [Hymenobacter sp. YC55]